MELQEIHRGKPRKINNLTFYSCPDCSFRAILSGRLHIICIGDPFVQHIFSEELTIRDLVNELDLFFPEEEFEF